VNRPAAQQAWGDSIRRGLTATEQRPTVSESLQVSYPERVTAMIEFTAVYHALFSGEGSTRVIRARDIDEAAAVAVEECDSAHMVAAVLDSSVNVQRDDDDAPAADEPEPAAEGPLSVDELDALSVLLGRHWRTLSRANRMTDWHVFGAAFTATNTAYLAAKYPV
jgi:hypothetical protein